MKVRHTIRAGIGAALTAVTILVVAGCSGGGVTRTSTPSPGITDTTLSLGISGPLTGPLADVGLCSVAGLDSYLEAKNAAGGFVFGDGKTRQVTLTSLDDADDPAQAMANFTTLVGDGMFAYVGAPGTAGNTAIMPVANEDKVPQVLLMSGAETFSKNAEANPWTSGLLPTYYTEATTFAKFLVDTGKPLTVAVLSENNDYGMSYLNGINDVTLGSKVQLIASASFDPGKADLDAQVTELAASRADILVSAVSDSALQVGVLKKAQSIGWLPRILLPSNASASATILIPGHASAYPAVYSATFSKDPTSGIDSMDADAAAYKDALGSYGSKATTTFTPECAWSYIEGAILEQAFTGMREPTREAFVTALRSITNYVPPLVFDGIKVDTTMPGVPAFSSLKVLQFTSAGFVPAGTF